MRKITLEVNNLVKKYSGRGFEVEALKNVSFSLYAGEFVAIMGTSGSGKSTLLNVIGALDEPTSGKIRLNGIDSEGFFSEPKATDYRRGNIGFIFQAYNLLKDLTVEENISLPLLLKNESKESIERKTASMVERMGLTKWKAHRPVQLSGGQQQRIAIGRALIGEPPILLADELTGNLDANTSKEILEVLTSMKDELKQSILVVTHDPKVATYADRVLFFHDGAIINEYECIGEQDLEHIMEISQDILKGSAI
ncbi:ABC transporter ATP-binding protein [Planococcus sp. CP5-4]|uniref:ABC transporter ATP-binding protein n=1 Tax=unclassified Planococcus (in: firmicutes) TaxID=2662419 RepID=UPI001C235AF0|nr:MULTISPECIES: ABC transporter ATP-binding protein [unclassified Planococcus (in: firmicutes)]MBU9673351.1 ABC transporter ATP-binding protein [Planococcus sp. CP5-4_YE]MBV0908124.1 ABC transporter ATP-binding protein [Planococcus sp. CP5-4_UN]MBW6062185.1 ABC transporter ATP-binding protein [Planococcus sp. CP5-4]